MIYPDRIKSVIPSQDDVEVGEEYLIPTTMVRPANGGDGERYEAIRVEVKEKHVIVNESNHRAAEGIND